MSKYFGTDGFRGEVVNAPIEDLRKYSIGVVLSSSQEIFNSFARFKTRLTVFLDT